jgi:hypothetical protein
MNLSTSVQQAHLQELGRSLTSWVDADLKYVWNAYLLQPLLQSPTYHPFILPLIYGFVGLARVNSCPVLLKSKMSRYRVGARYWRRGVNALGDAVMDTVTETVVFHPDHVSAFVISRGSVPLYWRHKNVEPFRTPVTELSQTLSEASIQACRLHFMAMEREYGAPPTIIDLLHADHKRLSQAYEKVVKEHLDSPVTYIRKSQNLPDSKKHFEAFLDVNIRKLIVNQSYFQVRRDIDTLQESPLFNQEGIFRYTSLVLRNEVPNVQQNQWL